MIARFGVAVDAGLMETLKSRGEFQRVYTRGVKQVGPALVLFFLQDTPTQRIGFVASRKVGGAVQRNRAKRLLRAACAEIETKEKLPEGWLVLIARKTILESKSHQVAEQLREMLSRFESNEAADNPEGT